MLSARRAPTLSLAGQLQQARIPAVDAVTRRQAYGLKSVPHRKDPSSLHFQRAEGAHPTARACCIADAASATSPHPSSLTNPTHTTAQPHHAPMCPPNPSSPTNPARTSLCRIPIPPWAPTSHLSQTPPAWRWRPRQWPPSAAPHSPPPAGTARLGGSTGSGQAVVRHGWTGGRSRHTGGAGTQPAMRHQ